MIEVVLPALFGFLIPALSIFLMYLHERCKENMKVLYADMEKICEIPETIDLLECVSLDSKDVGIIRHKPEQPIYRNADCEWKPVFTERKELRTNCRNCAAPLPKDGKCMYCGTENDREAPEEQNNARSEIKITPSSITFTCEPVMKYYQYESVATRDVYGRLHRKVINYNE